MMSALHHPLVNDYLDRLHAEAVRLGVAEGHELEASIREHFAEALPPGATEAQIRETIDRLGNPAELVDAAGGGREAQGVAPVDRGSGGREAAALLLLLGAAVVSVIWPLSLPMWIGGLVLTFLARRWDATDKLWAGVVLGAATPVSLLILGWSGTNAWSQACETGPGVPPCEPTGIGAGGWVIIALLLGYAALVVWTTVRLARAARRPR